MANRYEVYKCEICGNVVEVIHGGRGQLVCCGQPMKLMEKQREEQGYEKHLPVVEKQKGKILVKIGSIPHPMEEQHFIERIEAITKDDIVLRKYLNPGEKPIVEFDIPDVDDVREYCTIHGLWSKKTIS
ncbi:MAG: desulfoferrodoxin [Thermoplasmata archaeon]|nr:desulfoferrodoxin [Thermoplasmata archaeon]